MLVALGQVHIWQITSARNISNMCHVGTYMCRETAGMGHVMLGHVMLGHVILIVHGHWKQC